MPQRQLDESEEKMSTDEKPSRNEHEYFVKRDAELIIERRARLDEDRKLQERTSHYNKCPRCGDNLTEHDHKGVKIDQCDSCGGMWRCQFMTGRVWKRAIFMPFTNFGIPHCATG